MQPGTTELQGEKTWLSIQNWILMFWVVNEPYKINLFMYGLWKHEITEQTALELLEMSPPNIPAEAQFIPFFCKYLTFPS